MSNLIKEMHEDRERSQTVLAEPANTTQAQIARLEKASAAYRGLSDQQKENIHRQVVATLQERDVYNTMAALVGGKSVGYFQRGSGLSPIEITVRLPKSGLVMMERLLSTPVPASGLAGDDGERSSSLVM